MNDKSPRLGDYLAHIERAIVRIESYTAGICEVAFEGSNLTQDAVIRNLEIVGDACRNIERDAPAFAAAHRTATGAGLRDAQCALACLISTSTSRSSGKP